ncbi:MAG: segregation/condensation protein A [Deltaproteobacteria bacterium]|nr:segregation/condensation protein A [Deltaproteobacteria bacterium]
MASRKKDKEPPRAPEPPPPEVSTLPDYVKGEFDRAAAKDYVPRSESDHAYLRVGLEGFEGPLDLLLHLIQKHALDILNIPVSFITEKFLAVLDEMKAQDIDIAAEFLVMAATLAHIKSRMLLPPDEVDDLEEDEEGDPRAELVRRLLEYQKYKQAAADLMSRGLLFKDVWPRGRAGEMAQAVEETRVELGAMDLIAALEEILRRAKVPISHDIVFERMTVGARINEVVELCRAREHFTFETALMWESRGAPDRSRVVITLLALLEMARLKLVRIHQPAEGGTIYVTPNKDNLTQAEGALGADKDYV